MPRYRSSVSCANFGRYGPIKAQSRRLPVRSQQEGIYRQLSSYLDKLETVAFAAPAGKQVR